MTKTKIIYFIQQEGALGEHPIKIGQTTCISARLNNLQTANPYKLEVKAKFLTRLSDADIHLMFIRSQMIGEWFHPSRGLIGLINAINAKGKWIGLEKARKLVYSSRK